uniref:Delta(3,5)-Delta(2,4)-dienoyl-CoA isomerase, mitochondrial n=1 Tax=Haemonchus contortus TaxID=6289 RepID=A0A7I4Y6C4_HAECO
MTHNYEFLKVETVSEYVASVKLNRPKQLNALNRKIWSEIEDVFKKLDADENCRVVILSGEGNAFSSGLDIKDGRLMDLVTLQEGEDIARKARRIRRTILQMQQAFTNIEKCCKPVIAAVHGVCLGGGIDIITACDIRHSTRDAEFSVKEVDVGLAADVGSLNRLPKICGNESWIREIAFTARHFNAEEALKFDLVSRVYNTYHDMMREVVAVARTIAQKSPVAVQGTKIILNYSRDHTVEEGLQAVATWNQSQLMTEDVMKSGLAALTKSSLPEFSKL